MSKNISLSKTMLAEIKSIYDRIDDGNRIAKNLNLPINPNVFYEPVISMTELFKILSDETKCKELISRVKNRAFW